MSGIAAGGPAVPAGGPTIVFELCAETVASCHAAGEGGAHRIELCSGLSEGGLTPSHALMRAAIRESGLPVHVLLRPRAGGFYYSEAELALMEEEMHHARSLGASGFVAGVLDAQGRVDERRMRRLVELAAPLEVSFNRAFDLTPDLNRALEQVIDAGCRRLLTSGGAADVLSGARRVRGLLDQAQGRLEIAAGGGLRLGNAATVAAMTGAAQFHGSLRGPISPHPSDRREEFGSERETSAAHVRATIAELARGASLPGAAAETNRFTTSK